jgi:hypothetical protein
MCGALKRSRYSSTFAILFHSCSHCITPAIAPKAFKERNDKSSAVFASLQGAFANVAYSPIKHVYVVAHGGKSSQSYNYATGLGGHSLTT